MYQTMKHRQMSKNHNVKETLTDGKLFRMFPWVLSVKTRYAETASVEQATSEMTVEMCVTVAKRSRVGVLKLPYIRREL